jgi:subtilisin-like proprotein convertase family protein
MKRTTRTHLRQVVVAAAMMALAAAPAAHAQLAVQHDSTVVTETAGNGNGIPEPGDTLALTENVMSVDPDQTFTGVTGALSTTSPDVTINAGASPYPDLSFAAVAGNTTPFSVSLSPTMECGVSLPFTVSLQTSAGPTDVPFSVATGSAGTPAPYDSVDVPRAIPDGDVFGMTSDLVVPGTAGRAKHVVVRIGSILHTYDADLTISLIAPDGREVLLVSHRGGSGQNFTNTVFDDNATARITSTTQAPFTGTFQPAEPLSAMDGAPLAGTWKLKVVDDSSGNIGEVDAWGANIAPAVCAPQPSPQPPPPPPPPVQRDCGNGGATGGTHGKGRPSWLICPDHNKPLRSMRRHHHWL